MAEITIIDKDGIRLFHSLGNNLGTLDPARVNSHVLRAQQNDLKQILGQRLYHDFIEDATAVDTFTTPKYQELYDGKSYNNTSRGGNIYFDGVKPLLAAFAYARIVTNNSTHATRGGMVQKLNEYSEQKTQGQQNQKSQDAVSQAIALQSGLMEFLDQNASTYPEWNVRRSVAPRTAFRFNRVGVPIFGVNYGERGRPRNSNIDPDHRY